MRLIAIVNTTPTGTIMPTSPEPRPVNINKINISNMGAIEIFQFFDINTTPSPPNSAGKI